jgi:PIN domain nuclease of toxin-antitoxin system
LNRQAQARIQTPLAGLPLLHKDPFDRVLLCQATSLGIPLITPDARLHQYKSVPCTW